MIEYLKITELISRLEEEISEIEGKLEAIKTPDFSRVSHYSDLKPLVFHLNETRKRLEDELTMKQITLAGLQAILPEAKERHEKKLQAEKEREQSRLANEVKALEKALKEKKAALAAG